MKTDYLTDENKPLIYRNQLINPRLDLRTRIDMVPQATKPYLFDKNAAEIHPTAYFSERFPHHKLTYTFSGTEAISLALSQLSLQKDDVITILTTTQNFYISGCVTKAIEPHCRWSRKIEPKTKVIYVNHEFGFPYAELNELKKLNLPIIEDCAYAFSANNAEGSVGQVGDFVIFSLPKFFPMQLGGILLSQTAVKPSIDKSLQNYIETELQKYLSQVDFYSEKRRELYHIYSEVFSALPGCHPRFELTPYDVPGAFLFHAPEFIDLPKLKLFYTRQGIESSVFYGEQVYFLPLHQNLNLEDVRYLYILAAYFYEEMSKGL